MFSAYANNYASKTTMEDLFFGEGSWENPAIVESIDAFFVKAPKYLTPSANAVNFDDAVQTFFNASAAMFISGSWLLGNVVERAKFNQGFFFLPAKNKETH